MFKFDYNAVQTQFSELNQLGDMVAANSDLTYSVLKLTDANLVNSLNLISEGSFPGATAGEPVAGIPSFLWGCILGPVGLAIVYIATDEDKDETRKAMWGCIASVGVEAVVWIIYFAAVGHAII